MPCLSTSPMAQFYFYPISKVSTICCQTVLFYCGTMCCLLFQWASFRYQQECTACFTEKQRDLSIFMPLWQSICRPYFPKADVPKSIIFCPSFQKSLLLPISAIQPLDFIFYKLLPVLNIMLTVRFLFLPKATLLFIYMLLKPFLSKLVT